MTQGQSRIGSLLEAGLNILTGMIIAFSLSQLACIYQEQIRHYIYADFSWDVTPDSNLLITVTLTLVSIFRAYIWRRIFNHHHVKRGYR